MGNTLLDKNVDLAKQKESFNKYLNALSDLGEASDKPFFENKVFRTVSYKSQSMRIVIKVHLLRSQITLGALLIYENNFLYLNKLLGNRKFSNLLPFQKFINFTDQPTYREKVQQSTENYNKDFLAVCRQQLHTTLQDRLLQARSAGRSMTLSQKKYLALQILSSINQVHSLKLFHGHIRPSNFLLTASDHLVLVDFASYKPFYMREDQLGEFNTTYETSILHCTLAPEKFKSVSSDSVQGNLHLEHLPRQLMTEMHQMDMFSVGVVLAELFLDGQVIFTYEQLMKYRMHLYDPLPLIAKIQDSAVRDLVIKLLDHDPESRLDSQSALQFYIDNVLGEKKQIYQWLYYLNCAFSCSHQFSQPDLRIELIRRLFPQLLSEVCGDSQFNDKQINFQFILALPAQGIPVVNMFSEVISQQEPRLDQQVQNLSKLIVWDINKAFKSTLSTENVLSEAYENTANLTIREFKEKHQEFHKQEDNRHSSEHLKLSQVEKLRASFNQINKRYSNTQDPIYLQKQDSLEQSVPRMNSLLIQQTSQLQYQVFLNSPQLDFSPKKSDEARILVSLICVQFRNVRFMQTKLCALELLEFLSLYLQDNDNFFLTLPYITSLLEDTENQVVQYAFKVFIKIMRQLKNPLRGPQEVSLWKVFYFQKLMFILDNKDVSKMRIGIENLVEICKLVCQYEEYTRELRKDYPELQESLQTTFQRELLEYITQKLKEITSVKNSDWPELFLDQIGYILQSIGAEVPQEMVNLLISMFNYAELKLSILRNIAPLYQYLSQKQENKDLMLSCLEMFLRNRNEQQLFLTVRFFRQVSALGLIPAQLELHYIKSIAPLMVFPHLWVREEAIAFVCGVIHKQPPTETYLRIQPIVVNFLEEEVGYLDESILRMLLGKMVSRSLIDSKDIRVQDRQTEREKFITMNFNEQFLQRSNYTSLERDDSEERSNFLKKIDVLERRHDLEVLLGRRLNDFILQAFKANLFYYGGEEDKRSEVIIQNERIKITQYNQNNKMTDDWIIKKYLLEQKIDLNSDYVDSKKLKRLKTTLAKFQSDLSYTISRLNILSQMEFRNIQNAILIINSMDVKAKQVGIREEVSVSRVSSDAPKFAGFKPQQVLVSSITEHKDTVSCVQNFRDQRFFLSGSHDGTVRIYDMNRIDLDFTEGSVASISVVKSEEKLTHKVLAVRPIEFTDSFLVGTNTGFVELYKVDARSNASISQQGRFNRAPNGEVRHIESISESVFVYVTSSGHIVVEDIRSRRAPANFSVGKERGLVSSMVQRNSTQSTCISTLNGYCLVYDIRCNLISNVFQLMSPDDHPLPILTMANMKRISSLDGVEPTDLLALGFQSNNNEVGFWNLNDLNENVNPAIYLACSDKKEVIIQNPRLKNLYKNEQFKNFTNAWEERNFYDFVDNEQQMDLISYLKDPLTISQGQIKERWLIGTKNCYSYMKTAFEAKSSVTSIISLPLTGSVYPQNMENCLITASSDRFVQSWNLSSDTGRAGERFPDKVSQYIIIFKKEQSGTIICQPNYYEFQRRFTQVRSGDVYVIHDFEIKNNNITNVINREPQRQSQIHKKEFKTDHKDCITDMTFIEREQGVLITASRDNTIKIWK